MAVLEATLSIEPLSPQIGGIVRGVDLTQELSTETANAIREAFHDYSVLLFPAQAIEPDDQIRFASLFGNADGNEKSRATETDRRERRKGIMYVTNIRENGKPIGSLPDGEMHFHADGAHRAIPYRCTTLYAQRLPSRGGETKFANLYAAYDALSDQMKARLEGLKALHAHETSATLRDQVDDQENGKANRAVHPLVATHPVTGRKSLYLSRLMTRYIIDMDRAESDALLAELIEHAEKPEFVHAHKWTVDDLIIWDNRCVNHARNDFPEDEVRLLRRVTVSEPNDDSKDSEY